MNINILPDSGPVGSCRTSHRRRWDMPWPMTPVTLAAIAGRTASSLAGRLRGFFRCKGIDAGGRCDDDSASGERSLHVVHFLSRNDDPTLEISSRAILARVRRRQKQALKNS
mmetsp:Transcript_35542/g.77916  ORF Transcript_35542/g.77916 Transcript_35542/m.77916 type:complete len:112 (+) Transcript_35542:1064-1399(+)